MAIITLNVIGNMLPDKCKHILKCSDGLPVYLTSSHLSESAEEPAAQNKLRGNNKAQRYTSDSRLWLRKHITMGFMNTSRIIGHRGARLEDKQC